MRKAEQRVTEDADAPATPVIGPVGRQLLDACLAVARKSLEAAARDPTMMVCIEVLTTASNQRDAEKVLGALYMTRLLVSGHRNDVLRDCLEDAIRVIEGDLEAYDPSDVR
jgi:hypothetical protein